MIPEQLKAYDKLARLCSMKEYCEHEIRQKLRNYMLTPEQSEEILARLLDERYVDNARYTRAFVRDKIKFNKWGKQKVKQALYQKQIPDSIGSEFMDEIDQDDYEEMVRIEMEKKRRVVSGGDPWKVKNKLLRFGFSRGYEPELLYRMLDIETF